MTYSRINLVDAVNNVREGESIASTSRTYGVPKSTLRARVQGKYADKKPGAQTILTEKEESDLVEWIFKSARDGFPITKDQLFESVRLYVVSVKQNYPFKDNMPGRHWFERFISRHKNVSQRLTENVSLCRAKVTELGLRKWFEEIQVYLEENELLNID